MAFDTTKQPVNTGVTPMALALRNIGQTVPSLGAQIAKIQQMALAYGLTLSQLIDPTTGAIVDNTGGTSDAIFTAIAAECGSTWTAGQVKLILGIVEQVSGFYSSGNPAYIGAIQQT